LTETGPSTLSGLPEGEEYHEPEVKPTDRDGKERNSFDPGGGERFDLSRVGT
jgi:hypothetical protein